MKLNISSNIALKIFEIVAHLRRQYNGRYILRIKVLFIRVSKFIQHKVQVETE